MKNYTNRTKFPTHLIKAAIFVISFFAVVCITGCKAAKKSADIQNINQFRLDNGLEVFTSENHSVPLVYIEIAVRAGGVMQTPETAGLFHLYEHMMFKGNELYRDAASVQKAMTDMGVSNWNGTTSPDCVNYFFTIPKDQFENGLAFWNAAIRSPLMDKTEFESEKKVVLSEIEADQAKPSALYYKYYISHMFADAPYYADAAGSFDVVRNATIEQLIDIKNRFYIPNNAALFIGGDIDLDEAYELTNKIWGSWSNNGYAEPAKEKQVSQSPFAETQYAVIPFEEISEQIAEVQICFRGPDTDFNLEDVYAADYLENLLDNPDGLYKRALVKDEDLKIPDSSYVWGGGNFSRAIGSFDFGADMLEPSAGFTERVDRFLDKIQKEILPEIADRKSLYSKKVINDIVRKLRDNDIMSSQTAEGLLSGMRSSWLRATPDYYYTYNDRMGTVKQSEVQNFIKTYLTQRSPLVVVFVNPSVYEQIKDEFASKNYDVITADNSFWWKNPRYAPDASKIAKTVPVFEDDIYVPQEKNASSSDYELSAERDVDTYYLKNDIPVYVLASKDTHIDTVTIGVRGGVDRLTPESSGLESALFDVMSSNSRKYSFEMRKAISFANQSSISSGSKVAGSSLSLGTIDDYLYDMLPVLTDGFINPSFTDEFYNLQMTDYAQNVHYMLNNPESILDYEMGKSIYKNHLFETKVSITPDSLENITIENMKELHKKVLNAKNIFVVASGCFDVKKLISELDKTLGKMESDSSEVYMPHEVSQVKITGENKVLTHQSLKGTGYAIRVFKSPLATGKDYIPALIASDIYNTILFNVVREHYGACYTPSTGISLSRAPIGQVYIYKASDVEHLVSYVNEASNYMSNGNIITSVADDGTYKVSTIEDELESYKNSYIVATYSSKKTPAAIAGSLTYNILSYDDMFFTDKLNAQVMDVTAQQVQDVFTKYWVDEPSQWWFMVDPELKDKVKF